MKTHLKLVLLILAATAFAGTAEATCYKDGKASNTGDIVNGYRCKADGSWERV